MTITMKNYVFKIFYFSVLILPLLLFNNNKKKDSKIISLWGAFVWEAFVLFPYFYYLNVTIGM